MTTAFLFPGQGAQDLGMGKAAADASSAARGLFNRANDVLGIDLADLCFNGPKARLDETDIAQPALYVSAMAALEVLREQEPETVSSCEGAAGLSLGEYTALAFAGVFSFEDGLRLVRKRGEAMQAAAEAAPSAMASILMFEPDQVVDICEQAGDVRIANFLCPKNYVISGSREAVDSAVASAEAAGAKVVPLSVAGAFHTHYMQSAVDSLRTALDGVEFLAPQLPVWSNVDAQTHTDPAEIRELLARQVVEPVRWEDSQRAMMAQGFDSFVEVGPGSVLTGLLKRIDRKIARRNFDG